jgi:glycosyltransferase involved in cell wall biosynthesis
LLRGKQVDVLHSHKFGSNVWCAVLARLAAVPVLVTHEHSWSFKDDRVRIMLDRRLVAPAASAMIAVSAEDARRMIEVEGIPEGKVRVIPNGIAAVGSPDSQALRRELRLDEPTPIIGMIASLRPEKRVDLVLDAAKLLVDDDRRFHVAILGDGPLRDDLEARAEILGIAGRVSFLGYRGDARELAAGFDVALLSSDREGTPLSLLEYMALARAIVATSVGGIPDIVADEREALLVPPGDVGELAAAIARLLDSPEERARLGSAAAERQRKEYDIVATTRRLEDLYLELLGRK